MTPAENIVSLSSVTNGRVSGAAAGATALQETGFFRDREVFDALRSKVLPRIIEANRTARSLHVWCAGCASGQEAYSIAMLLREHFDEGLASWDIKIVGTDLAREAIEHASRGRYRRAEVNRGLPARMLVKYFAREGEDWVTVPELRAMCAFREADVCAPDVNAQEIDLVLMRNVLLFLPEQDRAAAFASVHHRLAAHGVLVLGQAEQAEDSTELFEVEYVHGCCFYRKAT